MNTIFSGLDKDIKDDLMRQLWVLWTHGSTAIEGNTLTLGETDFLLREGLLASNKPLKDCMEVKCHYDAVKLLFSELYKKDEVTPEDIKNLHRVMMPGSFYDPTAIGTWKSKLNATNSIDRDGKMFMLVYIHPEKIPEYINSWLQQLNSCQKLNNEEALDAYCNLHLGLVSIHPFSDGNGRMARLMANIPLLKNGYMPVILSLESRQAYLEAIRQAQESIPLKTHDGKNLRQIVIPEKFNIAPLRKLCLEELQKTKDVIKDAHALQKMRNGIER